MLTNNPDIFFKKISSKYIHVTNTLKIKIWFGWDGIGDIMIG